MWKVRIVGATVSALAVLAVFAATASAHARYKSSTPGKGEVVAASPARVSITFTQDIQKVAGTYDIRVNRDRGPSVTSGAAAVDNADRSTMSVALEPDLPQGRYVVNWTNASDADGHPEEGAFSFYVKTPPNGVDLQNDTQLESIGADAETPVSTGSAVAGGTSAPTAAATAATAAGTRTPVSATPPPSAGGGNDTKVIYIVIGGIAAGIVIALGGWFAFGRRNA